MKFAHGQLVALHAPITNGALSGDKLPSQLKLFGWGTNQTRRGPVKVEHATLSTLPQTQRETGFDRIALDFNHNTVPGHPNFQADPREVAAYGVPLVIEGEGLYLAEIQWTPAGEKYARNYADLSPTPLLNDDGEVTFLHSVALCPQGAVDGLSFYDAPSPGASRFMNPLHKLLAALLGLPDDTAEDQLLEAGQKRLEADAAAEAKKKEAADAAQKKKDDASAAEGETLVTLTARFDALERGNLMALAAQEGKVVPTTLRDLPLDKLTALIAELPVTVPLDRRTVPGLTPLSVNQPGGMSDADKAVAAQLGLTEADYK